MEKLGRIRLESIEFEHLPLAEVVRLLGEESRRRDQDQIGIEFALLRQYPPWTNVIVDPTTGLPFGSAPDLDPETAMPLPPSPPVDFDRITVTIQPGLRDIRLSDALKAVVHGCSGPVRYAIEPGQVIFSQRRPGDVEQHAYYIAPSTLLSEMKRAGLVDGNGKFQPAADPARSYAGWLAAEQNALGALQPAVRAFVEDRAGVYFDFPARDAAEIHRQQPTYTIFYNDRDGALRVQAATADQHLVGVALAPLLEMEPLGTAMPCGQFLQRIGAKLGCHFTLEYRSYALTSATSPLTRTVRMEDAISSIPLLTAKLRSDLPGFDTVQDPANPGVVHIVERALEEKQDYVLDRKVSLKYSGNVVGCVVKDSEGRNLVKGEGLTVALGKKVPGIQDGTDEAGTQGAFNDCVTVVNVDATNRSVRNVLTDCLPLPGYNAILWRAVTTVRGGKPVVLVQFYGSKR